MFEKHCEPIVLTWLGMIRLPESEEPSKLCSPIREREEGNVKLCIDVYENE